MNRIAHSKTIINNWQIKRYQQFSKDMNGELHKISILGPDKIFDSNLSKKKRFFWSFVIISCLCVCCYEIYDCVYHYLSYPVSTVFEIKENATLYFPPVTICSTLLDSAISEAAKELMQTHDQCSLHSLVNCPWHLLMPDKWNYTYENFTLNIGDVSVFLTCGAIVENEINCTNYGEISKTNFKNVKTSRGNCVTFNKEIEIKFHGPTTSLTIDINTTDFEMMDLNVSYNIFLFSDDDLAFYDKYGALNLKPGEIKAAKISINEYSFLNRKSSLCSDVKKKCGAKCVNDKSKHFGCKLPYMKQSRQPPCSNFSQIAETKTKFRSVSSNWFLECKCPKNCNSLQFSSPSPYVLNTGAGTKLRFLFEKNTYQSIKEQWDYTLASLLGDIGGNLGLFLGISIPGIIELLEAAIDYVHFRRNANNKNSVLSPALRKSGCKWCKKSQYHYCL